MFDKPNRRDRRTENLQNREDIGGVCHRSYQQTRGGNSWLHRRQQQRRDAHLLDARCVQTLRSSFDLFEYTRGETLDKPYANTRERRHAVMDVARDKLVDRLPETNSRRA